MTGKRSLWKPIYTITPAIARGLMEIEAVRAVVERTPLSLAAEVELRHRARIRSTHYSTRIEGNRLTLKEAQDIIEQKKTGFHGRERDVKEVRNYWDALLKVEDWAERKMEFGEDLIKRIHAVVERGKRAKATPYRGGQNVIRDSGSGEIIYMPPEAKDVAGLMNELVLWVRAAEKNRLPAPIIVALAHYQFVTIHPYFDGNGRTARLLATFILQKDDYGLNRFFSMEEHHARDLPGYYTSLAVHEHHNYYMGRAEADLTRWVEYFVDLLAKVFRQAKEETLRFADEHTPLEPDLLRQLDRRARIILGLFSKKERITAQDAAVTLGLSPRMVRLLLNRWTEVGLLTVSDASNRGRSYNLSAIYRQFIGNNTTD
jgi:Fic family protein